MYQNFNFKDMSVVHNEIVKIASIENDDEAIVKAFHFQRYYTGAIHKERKTTGYESIRICLSNIRFWMGNEDIETASRIDFLWGNIQE